MGSEECEDVRGRDIAGEEEADVGGNNGGEVREEEAGVAVDSEEEGVGEGRKRQRREKAR